MRCRSLRISFFVFALVGAVFGQNAATCSQCAEWNRSQIPFRIFGNTYYVGTHALSSVLITSKAGNILIDGDLPESAKQIAGNIQTLGFRIQDVKIIVNSHVHFDHAGGIAELQRLSGARVFASEWSAQVMRNGGVGRDDPQYGILLPIPRVKNVSLLHDVQTLKVGDISITGHLTPGHTPGGTTWTWKSCEDGVCHDIVYADSLSPMSAPGFRFTSSRDYPHAMDDFEKSFKFLETTPCDILISTHPEASLLWEHVEARQKGVKPDPMIAVDACRELAANGRQQLQIRKEEEAQKR